LTDVERNNEEKIGEKISTVGHAFESTVRIYGASPNLFDIVFPDYLLLSPATSKKFSGPSDLQHRLYSVQGSSGLILSSNDADSLHLWRENSHILLNSQHKIFSNSSQKNRPDFNRRLRPLGFMDSASYIRFTKYPTVLPQDALVSFPTFLRLANLNSMEELTIRSILLKLKAGISKEEKETIKQEIQKAISYASLLVDMPPEDYQVSIWDYDQSVVRGMLAKSLLEFFLQFAIVVIMCICFFSLMSSMYSNIVNQRKELGILRVLGMTKYSLYRLYIYEAFIVVFASSLTGLALVSFISWTMSLQTSLVNQLPLRFKFPVETIIILFILSIIFGFASSMWPLRRQINNTIVQLLR